MGVGKMNVLSKLCGSSPMKSGERGGLYSAQLMLKEKIDGDGKTVVYEFERLRRSDNASCQDALTMENEPKNRYVNVLPFDHTRARLKSSDNDFINASLVESKDSESPHWRYIATQGPLESTVSDFWLMVYEQKVNVVIMLTRTVENKNLEKVLFRECAQYFPLEDSATYGAFTVTVTSLQDLDEDITVRELMLTHNSSGDTRRVAHYHYHAWPDHGVPDTTLPLRRLSRLLRATNAEGTPVVHCSAGIGRTGTFCTVDVILRRLQQLDLRDASAAEKAVDIKRIVTHLRKQRVGMVQTPSQYLFCHQAVKEEIDEMLGIQEEVLTPSIAQSPAE